MNFNKKHLSGILNQVRELQQELHRAEMVYASELSRVHPDNRESARNLIYYRALRQFDLTKLQNELGFLGISRLARAQRHVMGSIIAIGQILKRLLEQKSDIAPSVDLSIQEGIELLNANAQELLGEGTSTRRVRIMVTLPSEAAFNYEMVKQMIMNGASCVRINCAHDTAREWVLMISNVRKAERELHCKIKVAMDLGGPKIRTNGIKKSIRIHRGNRLIVQKQKPLKNKGDDCVVIACSNSAVFEAVDVGESVLFDDGKISGVIEESLSDSFVVRVTTAGVDGKKLKEDKGINLPDTVLPWEGLTAQDKTDLAFVARHADIVNMSFVNNSKDVDQILKELEKYNVKGKLGLVLKVETKNAFLNLFEILLSSMTWYPFGIMIARGDLAVETGWSNMARIQTEILNICASAHAPVIWATQVLESLAKNGVPSRSEITDAAASLKAECVMLNKGPYIAEAIQFLDTILSDLESYQSKSDTLSPKLNIGAHTV